MKGKGYLFQRLLKHIFDPKMREHRQTWSYHFTGDCSQLATANQGICTDFFLFYFPKLISVCLGLKQNQFTPIADEDKDY